MNEDEIREVLKKAHDSAQPAQSSLFADVWDAAEERLGRSRKQYRAAGGIAATIAVMAIVAGFWPDQQPELSDDFLIADALMNSTSWSAPSDVLIPQRQFDIYQEIDFLNGSTNGQEGTLL